jgi:two-component system, LytTR family, sensor kinase
MGGALTRLAATAVAPAAPAPLPSTRGLPSWAVRLLALLAIGAVPGLTSATSMYFVIHAKEPAYTYWLAVKSHLPGWEYWALVAPLVLLLGRSFPWGPTPRRWAAIPVHLLAVAMLGVGHVFVTFMSGRWSGQPYYDGAFLERLPVMFAKNLHIELLTYLCILALGYALDFHGRLREREVRAAVLEMQLAQAQVEALKMQLHPHFLFNTLNTISVLVRKQDAQGSLRMLNGLSELLRVTLETGDRPFVSLKAEVEFLEKYLDIQKTRFQDRLRVSFEISPETLDAKIPSLLLQPLVENAVKHGINERGDSGAVTLRAHREGTRLIVEVLDDGPGPCSQWEERKGIGVANVEARLAQRYPGNHRFALERREPCGTRASIEIPFEEHRDRERTESGMPNEGRC